MLTIIYIAQCKIISDVNDTEIRMISWRPTVLNLDQTSFFSHSIIVLKIFQTNV